MDRTNKSQYVKEENERIAWIEADKYIKKKHSDIHLDWEIINWSFLNEFNTEFRDFMNTDYIIRKFGKERYNQICSDYRTFCLTYGVKLKKFKWED